jgi:hypothetical protein
MARSIHRKSRFNLDVLLGPATLGIVFLACTRLLRNPQQVAEPLAVLCFTFFGLGAVLWWWGLIGSRRENNLSPLVVRVVSASILIAALGVVSLTLGLKAPGLLLLLASGAGFWIALASAWKRRIATSAK